MTLRALNATLNGYALEFDCPACTGRRAHRYTVFLNYGENDHYNLNRHSGQFPDSLTVHNAFDGGCWLGEIRDGQVITHPKPQGWV